VRHAHVFAVADAVLNERAVYRGSHNKEMLIKELDRLGVSYDVRRLQVGDFLWIAQHISGALITQLSCCSAVCE